MRVFKFGGASVKDAEGVKNLTAIVRQTTDELVVVISAMGKTTNALEALLPTSCNDTQRKERLEVLRDYHYTIARQLSEGLDDKPLMADLDRLFAQLDEATAAPATAYNIDYDRIVSFGELISTTIISHYLRLCGMENQWLDVRQLIRTDSNHREGHVDWVETIAATETLRREPAPLAITQGFIAGANDGTTTTLGREGSDYSAAILSYCLNAESMTIWKDVPGFLNADPKYFSDTIKIDRIPYNEAIELAYYGASVIHPKTVKPLKNKNIPLYIKSFITPDDSGSAVGPYNGISPETPLYIVRPEQVLISIAPKDFSFIAEQNLQMLFGLFAEIGVRINVMQNSALSFSVCIDHNAVLLDQLLRRLQDDYYVRYNAGLHLITIRYYTQTIIDHIVSGRPILLEQRSRQTEQIVVEAK